MPEPTPPTSLTKPSATSDKYAGHKFLIVDDNAFVRGIVQSMLLKNGARHIKHAASGKEALEAMMRSPCDCIISDWNMSPIGGLELLQTVRTGRAPRTAADTCFILLTGHADANVVNVAINLDVSGYLVKPVSFEKLSQSISAALQRKVQVKGPKFYEAVPGVSIEPPLKALPKDRTPPWVSWMMKSPKRAQYEERLQRVREEIAEAARNDNDKQAGLRNRRQTPIDDIPAGSRLAEDIYGEQGKLLIGAGTVLSASVLGRLQEMTKESGEDVKLWIGDT